MKKTLCIILLVALLVAAVPALALGADYKAVNVGSKYLPGGSGFMGGLAYTSVVNSGGYYSGVLMDKNGKVQHSFPLHGNTFTYQFPDGNWIASWNSYASADDIRVWRGNYQAGVKPTLMSNVYNITTHDWGGGSNVVAQYSELNDFMVLNENEFNGPKYLYDTNGKRVYNQPIENVIDRGNVWLELVDANGKSTFINRQTWKTADRPAGRYSTTGGYGVEITKKGQKVTEYAVYNEAGEVQFTYTSDDYLNKPSEMYWVDGYCVVYTRSGSRYYNGMIDTKGNVVIPLEYARMGDYEDGVIRAATYKFKTDNSYYYGLIDIEENVIVDFKYGYITPFEGGIAAYRAPYMRDRGGYIDMKGNELVSDCYYHTDENTLAKYGVYVGIVGYFELDNNYALYDRNGNRLTQNRYAYIGPFSEGLACVYTNVDGLDWKIGFIDVKGREVIPSVFDYKGYIDTSSPMTCMIGGAAWMQKGSNTYIVHNPLVTYGLTVPKNNAKVVVNGEVVPVDAYTINDMNYFKLRDVAAMLSGTEKQFNVQWNSVKGAIEIVTDTAYKGSGVVTDGKKTNNAKLCQPIVYRDGAMLNKFDLQTYRQTYGIGAYTIDSLNYFQLRDLGKLLDFNVGWDAANNAISIDTTKSYQ